MAGSKLEARTTTVEQTMAVSDRGALRKIYRVQFMVGDHGPYYVELPEAEFTPDRVKAEQAKVAATLNALL